MYFKFFKLHSWGKRSVSRRRQFNQRFRKIDSFGPDAAAAMKVLLPDIPTLALALPAFSGFPNGVSRNCGFR